MSEHYNWANMVYDSVRGQHEMDVTIMLKIAYCTKNDSTLSADLQYPVRY